MKLHHQSLEAARLEARIDQIHYFSRNGFLTSEGQTRAESLIEKITGERNELV